MMMTAPSAGAVGVVGATGVAAAAHFPLGRRFVSSPTFPGATPNRAKRFARLSVNTYTRQLYIT